MSAGHCAVIIFAPVLCMRTKPVMAPAYICLFFVAFHFFAAKQQALSTIYSLLRSTIYLIPA
jgi:hypothetical protein